MINPALDEGQLSGLPVVGLYPTSVRVFAGPIVSFTFFPSALDRTQVRVSWLVPEPYLAGPDAEERLRQDRQMLGAIMGEDRLSCSDVQRGLKAPDAAAGPLSPIEATIAEFGRYLARRLLGGNQASSSASPLNISTKLALE